MQDAGVPEGCGMQDAGFQCRQGAGCRCAMALPAGCREGVECQWDASTHRTSP